MKAVDSFLLHQDEIQILNYKNMKNKEVNPSLLNYKEGNILNIGMIMRRNDIFFLLNHEEVIILSYRNIG